jgi:PII-like signaling protein
MAIKSYSVELSTELPIVIDTATTHDELSTVVEKTQQYLDDTGLSEDRKFFIKIVGVKTETTN